MSHGFLPDWSELEWGLLLAALLVLMALLTRYYLRVRPGPIRVELPVSAVKDADEGLPAEMAAIIAAKLAEASTLPPPEVPSGDAAGGIGDVISKVLPAPTELLPKLLSGLPAVLAPERGHALITTMHTRVEAPTHGITAKVVDLSSRGVEGVETLWAAGWPEAATRAAGYVRAVAESHSSILAQIPTWRRWSDRTGQSYMRLIAIQEKEGSDLAGAIDDLRGLVRDEPRNAEVRLRLANALMLNREWLDALFVYVEVIREWPEIPQAHYRLAALLSCEPELGSGPRAAEAMLAVEALPDVESGPSSFLSLSKRYWSVASRRVRVSRWGRARERGRVILARRAGLPSLAKERELAVATDIAALTTDAQCGGREPKVLQDLRAAVELRHWQAGFDLAPLRRRLLRRRDPNVPWGVEYNRACFYAQVTQSKHNLKPGLDRARAMDSIRAVVRQPESRPVWPWLFFRDPDLEVLRRTGSSGAGPLRVLAEEMHQTDPDVDALSAFHTAWAALQDAAAHRSARLVRSWDGIPPWSRQRARLEEFCAHERRAWSALADWAGDPANEQLQEALASSVGGMVTSDRSIADASPANELLLRRHSAAWSRMEAFASDREQTWARRLVAIEGDEDVSPDWPADGAACWAMVASYAEAPMLVSLRECRDE